MFHEKYLKYKYKYLNLKQQTILQYGGDLPSFILLKGINFFKCPEECDPYTSEMISGSFNDDLNNITLLN